MNKNMQRTLSKFNIETEGRLREMLEYIPEEDRKVFEAKWGIDEKGDYCNTYILLSRKLGIEKGAKELYAQAESLFMNVKYVMMFEKQKYDYTTFKLAANYGKLLEKIFSIRNLDNFPKISFEEIQRRCEKEMRQLTIKEASIIEAHWGLKDIFINTVTTKEIADSMKLTVETIRRWESKGFKKLKHPRSREHILGGSDIKSDDTPIFELGFSERTEKFLRNKNITTLRQIRKMINGDFVIEPNWPVKVINEVYRKVSEIKF